MFIFKKKVNNYNFIIIIKKEITLRNKINFRYFK